MKIGTKIKLISVINTLCFGTGCVITDPALHEEISAWRASRWQAPLSEAKPDEPTGINEEEVDQKFTEHKGPWQAMELIDIALENNPATMQSWELAKANAYLWKSSKSTLYPVITLDEELLLQKVTGSQIGNNSVSNASSETADSNSNTLAKSVKTGNQRNQQPRQLGSNLNYNQWFISTLSFSYLMWDFGGRLATIEAARQALFAANWSHNRTIQTVILNVLLDYYQHLQAKALYNARMEDLHNSQENFNAAEGQFEMGVAKKLDVLLAKSNLANAQLLLEEQKGYVQTSMGQLATSLGLPANAIFDVADLPPDDQLDKIQESIDELISIAKIERPDLAAAEANYKTQKENATVIWSEGMPSLYATGFVQQNSNIHYPGFNSQVTSGTVGLNIPLFNGFYYVNQTRAANANAAAAYAAWKAQEESVILDVVTSYYNFTTAVETVKFSEQYFEYTNEAYQIAFESYRHGVGTILDLLAAQAALSNARAQKIIARTQWITAITNVAYATGSL